MFGGGTFLTQNKVLPGVYSNFISKATANATLSNRGVVAMALDLNWGIDGQVFTVEASDFQKNSLKIFGYAYDAPEFKIDKATVKSLGISNSLQNKQIDIDNSFQLTSMNDQVKEMLSIIAHLLSP